MLGWLRAGNEKARQANLCGLWIQVFQELHIYTISSGSRKEFVSFVWNEAETKKPASVTCGHDVDWGKFRARLFSHLESPPFFRTRARKTNFARSSPGANRVLPVLLLKRCGFLPHNSRMFHSGREIFSPWRQHPSLHGSERGAGAHSVCRSSPWTCLPAWRLGTRPRPRRSVRICRHGEGCTSPRCRAG